MSLGRSSSSSPKAVEVQAPFAAVATVAAAQAAGGHSSQPLGAVAPGVRQQGDQTASAAGALTPRFEADIACVPVGVTLQRKAAFGRKTGLLPTA